MIGGKRHIAIMQPYFFPYIGYWQLIAAADVFVIYDDGKFIRHGWISRNRILGYDGKPLYLGLELDHQSRNRKICEIERTQYSLKHNHMLKTLQMRYSKAPYYEQAMQVLEPLLLNEEPNLVRFCKTAIEGICCYLGIDTEIHLSTEVSKEGLDGVEGKVERICRHFGIMDYINPIGGTEFYDKDEWASNGLGLQFLRRNDDISYKQFGQSFVPDLSIIDMMMFCSADEIRGFLKRFELV